MCNSRNPAWPLLLALLAPVAARASNPESTMLSPESSLAGAVVAADDDGGGGWYNPASLGGLKRSSVQLGISAYSYAWVNSEGVLTTVLPWETQSQNTRASRYSSVPSVLGLTYMLREGLGLSLGLWTPFHDSFSTGFSTTSRGALPSAPNLQATLDQRYDWSQSGDDTWATAAVGWQVHPKVRLGLSLQGALLTRSEAVALTTTLTTDSMLGSERGAHIQVSVNEAVNRLSLRAVLGVQWLVSKYLRLALALRSPQLQVARWGQHVQTVLVSALLPGFAPQEGSYIDTKPPGGTFLMVEQVRGLVGGGGRPGRPEPARRR